MSSKRAFDRKLYRVNAPDKANVLNMEELISISERIQKFLECINQIEKNSIEALNRKIIGGRK